MISLKHILKEVIEEESVCGTGASIATGQGEQYATPKAFKKKLSAIKALEEDVDYTPEKSQELIAKYEKEFGNYESQAERLNNVFQAFSIGDLLEQGGEDKLNKIEDTAEHLHGKLNKIWSDLLSVQDSLEDDNKDIRDKAVRMDIKYNKLYKYVWQIYNFSNKIRAVKDNLKDQDLKDLTQYKVQK